MSAKAFLRDKGSLLFPGRARLAESDRKRKKSKPEVCACGKLAHWLNGTAWCQGCLPPEQQAKLDLTTQMARLRRLAASIDSGSG